MSAPQFFSFASTSPILHSPANNQVYTRSTDAADALLAYDIIGVVSAAQHTASSTLSSGSAKIEKSNGDIWDSIAQVNLTGGAAAGTVTVYNFGTAGTAQIIILTTPNDGDTWTFGLTGFTDTITWRTALTLAADEVLIGGSNTAAADNLKRYLNNNGVVGVNYANAPAHPYVSATVVGNSITVTDLVPCARQLPWVISQTGTALSFPSTLSGGLDGTVVATLDIGTTSAFNSFTTSNPGLSGNNFPANFNDWSNWVNINGRPVTLEMGMTGANLDFLYQTASNQNYPRDGLTTGLQVLNGPVVSVNLEENAITWLRIKIDNSGNSTPFPVDVIANF